MSREIKFRGFATKSKKMVDLHAITPLALQEGLLEAEGCGGVFIPFRDDIKLMQFTGLKDKNGVEIYEGDILQCDSEDGLVTGQIVFGEAGDESIWWSGFRLKVIDVTDYPDDEPVEIKVIGNIYENPELLEVSA